MRVTVIGPSFPSRGGIAHYTSALVRQLQKKATIQLLAHTSMYVASMYPGTTELDPSDTSKPIEGAIEISGNNIRSWKKAYNNIESFSPDVLVLQWWTQYWFFFHWYLLRKMAKKLPNCKVVCICHNPLPHDCEWHSRALSSFLLPKVYKTMDVCITHSIDNVKEVQSLLPKKEVQYTKMPAHFPMDLQQTSSKKDSVLDIIFVGFIRPYKGVDVLLEAVSSIPKDREFLLTVAGEFWIDEKELQDYVHANGLQDNVRLINRYIPDDELYQLIMNADIAVLPYKTGTQSGVCSLIQSFGKPIIATNVSGLHDYVTHKENGFLVEPNNPNKIADALLEFSSNTSLRNDIEENCKNRILQKNSWQETTELLLKRNES